MAAEVNSGQGPAKTSWCYWSLNWALRAGFSGLDTKMESLHLSDALTVWRFLFFMLVFRKLTVTFFWGRGTFISEI